MNKIVVGIALLFSTILSAQAFAQQTTAAPKQSASASSPSESIEAAKLGNTRNVHRLGELYFAGQIPKSDIPKLKENKFGRVITLRTPGEIDWDEKAAVESDGIEFIEIPFGKPDTLTDEIFDTVRKTLADDDQRTLFHCGSANRVGGVWLTYRVLDQGVDLETAIKEAQEIGLRSAFIKLKAYNYIERKLAAREAAKEKSSEKPAEKLDRNSNKMPSLVPSVRLSVRPGINKPFLADDLDVDAFVKRFEMESREVYDARERILSACKISPGDTVGDIGAGTGLFTRIFANAVGENGWVYAVDIAPRFLEHINREGQKVGQKNVTSVLGAQDSVSIPPNTCDLIFVCDTYHHFEYPASTLKSIHSALKPDGRLVLIDFERIEGQSREWILNHMRAGKEVFRAEIEAEGFELAEEKQIVGFKENYFLIFKKK